VKKLGIILAFGLGALACGDDSNKTVDAPTVVKDTSMIDGPMIDAPPAASTLTTYVIDLIKNHTDSMSPPRAYTEFSTLPDPDGTANNGNGTPGVYASLFM
jgi:hypothetical protein